MSDGSDEAEPTEVDPFADEAPPETAPVRHGEELDWQRIEAHLRAELPAEVLGDGAFSVEQFPNGSANLTYLLSSGDRELVLRRPPFGTLAPGAHDMKREFAVLSRLWRHFDRAPRAYLFCQDHRVAGADFFVMERRPGEVVRSVVPPSMRHHDRVGRRMGLALIDAVADLHLLDPVTCGLDDLGRPGDFMARQVRGWRKRWDLVADPAWDGAMTELHGRLDGSIPEAQRVSLTHNDLKLDNCMFDPLDPDRVIAFFDWDMTTLGDPLCDLGTLMNYWPDPDDRPGDRRTGKAGLGVFRPEPRWPSATVTAPGSMCRRWPGTTPSPNGRRRSSCRQLHHRWLVGDSTDERMAIVADSLPLLVGAADGLLRSIDR